MNIETVPLPEVELWQGDYRPKGEWEPCVLCDRPVRIDRAHYRVELIGGYAVRQPSPPGIEHEEHHAGTYAIGPVCRRKLPKGFVMKT